jgi:hypothetical protein
MSPCSAPAQLPALTSPSLTNYLGTGVYTAGESTIQVYHAPFSYKLQEPVEVSLQHEVGITLDTFPGMKVLGIPFSRIGLGVRIGNKGEAIRLVFGKPY